MGLVKRSGGGGSKIPSAEKIKCLIEKAIEDEGDYGPQGQLNLRVVGGEYDGEQLTEWCKLAQPRLNRVKALREEGLADKAIAKSLQKSGFEFKKIDEPEEPGVADGGKLFNICMAAFDGNVEAIDSFKSVSDFLKALEGRTFISITKKRGKSGDYVGITWDQIFTDPDADFDDIPF
jgi:hypothetical protein